MLRDRAASGRRGSPIVCDDCIQSGRLLTAHCGWDAAVQGTEVPSQEDTGVARQGQADADALRGAVVDERKGRAGRVEFIREAAQIQMDLAKISRRIKEAGLNLEQHNVHLSRDQEVRLVEAREYVLNAGDLMHSLAIQFVGEIRKE